MILDIIQFIATFLSITGSVLITNHQVRFLGFLIWTVSNLAWIISSIMLGNIYMLTLFVVYFITNMYAVKDEWCNRKYAVANFKRIIRYIVKSYWH
jgi:hypothetical protein